MGDNIHRKKLFGGRATAMEFHQRYAWPGQRCNNCGAPPNIRINSFIPLSEYFKRISPLGAYLLTGGDPTKIPPTYETIYGPMIPISAIYACSTCQPAAERAAAHAPSWYLVEIDRGPGQDKAVIQVPRSYRPEAAKSTT